MDEKEKTRVIFKMTPQHKYWKGPESECIAFLLDCDANYGRVLSYMHVGQHSEASIDFMRDCRPAKPEEYAGLKQELEFIGYELSLRRRWNGKRQ